MDPCCLAIDERHVSPYFLLVFSSAAVGWHQRQLAMLSLGFSP